MGPTAYTLLSGDLIFQMLRFQELMGSARSGTFCGHYIISTHVFNCLKPFGKPGNHWCIFAFLIPISGSCRAHRKDTECGIAASVVHAEVALTSALPLQLELKKVTLNQGVCRYCIPKEQPQQQKRQQRRRQSNRGDYTCSSSSSGNVAGSSLGVVAVVAGMFELGKVRTQALCPWKKKYQTALLRAC